MYYAMMIWTYNKLIARIVVKTWHSIINMMRFNNMRAIFLSNKLSTYLTSIPILELKIISVLLIKLSIFYNLFGFTNCRCHAICTIVELCFHLF